MSDSILSATLAERIDRACTRFERAWRDGSRPRLEDFLVPANEPDYLHFVRELVAVDIYHRQKRGVASRTTDYQDRFPGLDLEGQFGTTPPPSPGDSTAWPAAL